MSRSYDEVMDSVVEINDEIEKVCDAIRSLEHEVDSLMRTRDALIAEARSIREQEEAGDNHRAHRR